MERIVIVGYKPFAGKSEQLKALSLNHWQKLNEIGLVSNRKPIIMESAEGSIIEVFGWKSKSAMQEAHANPKVLKMWKEYSEVCEYVPIKEIKESENLFSEFTPID
jgi:hypothetical protein